MSNIAIGAVHHISLTVSNLEASRHFYGDILGLQLVNDSAEHGLIGFSNGSQLLALRTPFDTSQTPSEDRFNENRLGLDHLSFSVSNRTELEEAIVLFDANDIEHGEINDLSEGGFPILVLAFRDPDNIQLELTAPAS